MTIRLAFQKRWMLAVMLTCCSLFVGPLFGPDAQARPAYKSVFEEMYRKVKEGDKKTGCTVCHSGKSKKNRNHYGAALKEAVDTKNEKNKAKIKKALKKIEKDSCPHSDQKWIERLEEGNLPCPHGGSGQSHRIGTSYIGRQLAMPETDQ
jgi:hypothetical protein